MTLRFLAQAAVRIRVSCMELGTLRPKSGSPDFHGGHPGGRYLRNIQANRHRDQGAARTKPTATSGLPSGFYIFKWSEKIKRRTFPNTWELHKILNSGFISKVFLEHSHAHLFSYCLWLSVCCNGRVECLEQTLFSPQSLKYFTILACYTKNSTRPLHRQLDPRIWSSGGSSKVEDMNGDIISIEGI